MLIYFSFFKVIMNEVKHWNFVQLKIESFPLRFRVALKGKFSNQVFIICVQSIWIPR